MPRAAPRRVPRSSASTAPESIVQLTLGNLLAGLLVLLIVALLVYGFRRTMRPRIASPELDDPALPALHLRLRSDDAHVVPEVIRFPTAGKLRIGYHPPFMDRHVGKPDFARLEFVDVRGDGAAARDLSRHAACIWRDPGGECFIQAGWPGPGEPIRPRTQTRVLRFGRAQDATSQPFRLVHRDVLRLSATVEYVFLEVEPVHDRPTPEQKKIDAFESSTLAPSSSAKLSLLRPERRSADDDDDDLA
jgi:hypothetical protein